jgi:zinc/manganese transport system substrate-binding protein
MFLRRNFLATSALSFGTLLLTALPISGFTADRSPVVASFSILGDMASRIGGAHVAVTSLVGPNGDAHMYRPTPTDARAVSESALLITNGLGFEGWLDRLIEASDFKGVQVLATQGIKPIAFEDGHEGDHKDHDDHDGHGDEEHADDHDDHGDEEHADDHDDHGDEEHADDHDDHDAHDHDHDHGANDPHAWQSIDNAILYVTNIAAALAQADPGHADFFAANRDAYIAELRSLDAEIHQIIGRIEPENRIVVTSHDAFQYFGRDYGLTFLAPQGLSTESEASAKDIAALIKQIRADGVKAIFVENITDTRLLERIADETGAAIGGILYPGALSDADGPASTYIDMMRHNAKTIAEALAQG